MKGKQLVKGVECFVSGTLEEVGAFIKFAFSDTGQVFLRVFNAVSKKNKGDANGALKELGEAAKCYHLEQLPKMALEDIEHALKDKLGF